MVRAVSRSTQWTGKLPATQDYVIEAVSGGEATNYSLYVVIPQVIRFQPGATSATVPGTVPARGMAYYLARGMAGQTMTTTITSPNSDVLLEIYGFETGDPLVRHVTGSTTWTGVLPATQDYMIHALSVGEATNFTLEIVID